MVFLKFCRKLAVYIQINYGYGLKDTPHTGLAWVLLDWKLKIISRPNWNEKLHVRTWPSDIMHSFCIRDYEILNENNEKIAIATSRWVLYDLNKKQIFRLNDEIHKLFAPENLHAVIEPFEKLKEPENYDSSFKYHILKRDIDTNKHLNNLNYISLATELLPEKHLFNNIDVMYKKQCLLGENIVFLQKKISDEEYIVSVKSEELTELHAILKFKI